MASSAFAAFALLALALALFQTAEARVLKSQRRNLRLQHTVSASLSESLSIDLHTRREGVPGTCSQYVWLFVGPKPGVTPAPGAYTFLLDPCFSPPSSSSSASGKSKAAGAAGKSAVVVDYPHSAQSAGGVAASAASGAGVNTIRVKVYDVSRLSGVRSGTGIACSWSQHEGEYTDGADAGGVTAVSQCDSCGSVEVNEDCNSTSSSQGKCAPVTVTCAFGPDASGCSGVDCGYGKK